MNFKAKAIWLAALAGLVAGTAMAAGPAEVRAKVPFDFVVADQQFPAGEYAILQLGLSSAIRIESMDLSRAVAVFPTPGNDNKTGYRSALAFRKYGDRYFLTDVWTSEVGTGTQIPECKTEKQLRQDSTAKYTVAVVRAQ